MKNRALPVLLFMTAVFMPLSALWPFSNEFKLGRDRLFEEHFHLVNGKKVGFFGNVTTLETLDRLIDDKRLEVVKIFVPEHGLSGRIAAGEQVENSFYRDIPVISAYGPGKRKIDPLELSDLDCLVFEIQDIGNRHYTYLTTLYLQMTACAQAGIPFILLDRPNGAGSLIEGPLLEKEYQSYIGLFGPNAHGMTQGELARLFIKEEDLLQGSRYDRQGEYKVLSKLELHVVEMANYQPRRGFWQQGQSLEDWIPPSPNIPTPSSAFCYKGNGLFDGYEIKEIVRGYQSMNLIQFQDIQLPRMKELEELTAFIERCYQNWNFQGVNLLPLKNTLTGDWDIIHFSLTDFEQYHSTLATLAIIYTWESLYFPAEASGFYNRDHFDKVIGNSWVSAVFTDSMLIPFDEIVKRIRKDELIFEEIRSPYLIYGKQE